jgi:hypothetical protein
MVAINQTHVVVSRSSGVGPPARSPRCFPSSEGVYFVPAPAGLVERLAS